MMKEYVLYVVQIINREAFYRDVKLVNQVRIHQRGQLRVILVKAVCILVVMVLLALRVKMGSNPTHLTLDV